MTVARRMGDLPEDLFAPEPEEKPSGTQLNGQAMLRGFLGREPGTAEKRKGSTISDSKWEKVRRQVSAMIDSTIWSDATGVHFAALYEILHEKVYGVLPAELKPPQRLRAAAMANRMLLRDFSDDASKMAMFMRWVWTREIDREKWRRANNRDGARISWSFCFNGSLVTDYRIHLTRVSR